MKSKKFLSLALAVIMCLPLLPMTALAADMPTQTLDGANPSATGNFNWTGEWDTSYGALVLTQNGNTVTGTYPHDSGKITATAAGNMLYGSWAESPSYAPPNDSGDFEFVMSDNGMSFIGHSRYGSTDSWRSWTGNRVSGDPAAPTSTTPGTPPSSSGADPIPTNSLEGADLNAVGNYNWSGKWEDTVYGELIITQNGSIVTGTYPHDSGKVTATAAGNMLYGTWAEAPSYTPPNDGGDFEFVMSEDGMSFIGHSRYGSNDVWRTWNGKRLKEETSGWATGEIEKANALGLIPDSLKGADLTKPITRAEFAAVSVKVYENLSGTAAIPAVNNPFTDTKDIEVLKAYNVGVTSGTSATTFAPNVLLNREQAAAMLTRVFKKVSLAGWTMATDSQFTLQYTKPAKFADDAKISDWAKDSVYFMAANGIINGTGNNNFSPKATTPAEQARNYASATREQALAIAVRMVENLGK